LRGVEGEVNSSVLSQRHDSLVLPNDAIAATS
jgi:hypothetical protein